MVEVEAELERLVRTLAVEPYVGASTAAVKKAMEDALDRFSPIEFGGTQPAANQLGIRPIKPLDFNLTTFRKVYTAAGWQTGPISGFALSRHTYIVVFGYQNVEPVPKSVELQWTIAGTTRCIEDLKALPLKDDHKIGIDPFILSPGTSPVTLDVNIAATGYDELAPVGVVLAPGKYLISRTFLTG